MAKEEKAEKTTPVEMTELQKKEYLKFLEKQEEAKILAADAEEFKGQTTVVALSFRHNINGKKFGPGKHITIPMELLGLLQNQEDRKRAAEIKMLTSNKRLFEVLQSGGSIEIGGQRKAQMLK